MNKQDKKFEKKLVETLTVCCENFKEEVEGFNWLTHTIDFSNRSQSIKIICVFENNIELTNANEGSDLLLITNTIINCLKGLDITLKNPTKHIRLDSEENCILSHQGNWEKRIHQQYS